MGSGAIRKNFRSPSSVWRLSGWARLPLTLGNGDAVVERGFKRAIADMDGQATSGKPMPVIAGSEEFWLTHLVHDAGAAHQAGDRGRPHHHLIQRTRSRAQRGHRRQAR